MKGDRLSFLFFWGEQALVMTCKVASILPYNHQAWLVFSKQQLRKLLTEHPELANTMCFGSPALPETHEFPTQYVEGAAASDIHTACLTWLAAVQAGQHTHALQHINALRTGFRQHEGQASYVLLAVFDGNVKFFAVVYSVAQLMVLREEYFPLYALETVLAEVPYLPGEAAPAPFCMGAQAAHAMIDAMMMVGKLVEQ